MGLQFGSLPEVRIHIPGQFILRSDYDYRNPVSGLDEFVSIMHPNQANEFICSMDNLVGRHVLSIVQFWPASCT